MYFATRPRPALTAVLWYMVLGLTAKGLFRQENLVNTWFGHEPFAGVPSITERVEEPGA